MKMKNYSLLIGGVLILAASAQASATDQVIRVALLSSSADSALYKWNDNEGRIHYSDKPPVGRARDYDPQVSPPKGTVQVEAKATPESLPMFIAPRNAANGSAQKPKPDLAANLVWLDKTAR